MDRRSILRIKSDLTFGRVSIWRGMSFFPQTQVLKDLSNDVPLVNEAMSFKRARDRDGVINLSAPFLFTRGDRMTSRFDGTLLRFASTRRAALKSCDFFL